MVVIKNNSIYLKQKVPFSGDLPDELSLGNEIVVTGFVLPNCIRFSVNLTCGKGSDADIAFHFNPRLDRNCIVRNCRKRGRWDQEEISSVVKTTIKRNKNFEIAIFVAKEEFLVFVNGKHFCAFTFRIPLNLCKRIEVHGLVNVTNVERKLWLVYSKVTSKNSLLQISHGDEALKDNTDQLKVPFSGNLPNELSLGNVIVVTGFVLSNCIRFAVNLTCGKGSDADIAFHFNPRLDRNCIVRNSRKRGRWDKEEVSSVIKTTIERNKNFEIAIFVAKEEFLVFVNQKHFCAFTFRIPLNLCKRIEVHGLIDVTNVEHKLWSVYPEVTSESLLLQISHGEEALRDIANQLKVPFSGDLPNELSLGNVIVVTGFVLPNCIRFSVNLTCGEGSDADIAFHFNPRLDRNCIVRNCRKRGRWDQEEISSVVKTTIERNKNFEIAIFVAKEEFLVSVNGKHFCAFTFRIPLNLCKRIEVHGLIDVTNVEHKLWSVYPEVTSENPLLQIPHGDEALRDTTDQLTVPLTGHLPKGFQEGWQLEINGRVKLLPHSFYINLQDGAQLWPHPIIPLHLNPRFNTSSGEDIFIRNARCDGHWGPEERTRNFQFSPGSPFNLAIRRGFDRFSVWIDGQLSGEFKYRGNADNINTVYIQGDIFIKNVVMHEKIMDLKRNYL